MRNIVSKVASAFSLAFVSAPFLSISALAQSYSYEYSSSDGGAGAFVFLFSCCIVLFSLAIWIGLAYWVYKDALKHGVENPILWAILTLAFGLVGLLIYVLAARNKGTEAKSMPETKELQNETMKTKETEDMNS